jgi:hypothetical protein
MNISRQLKKHTKRTRGLIIALLLCTFTAFGVSALTATASASVQTPVSKGGFQCGSGKNAVGTSINIGCEGTKCKTSNKDGCSALLDAVFAIVRFLSAGVGIVIIGSTVFAGVLYSASKDDPGAVSKAKARLMNNGYALMMFIFAYAILNFVIPGGFFK